MSTVLVAALRAQIAEDERIAEELYKASRLIGYKPNAHGIGGSAAVAFWQRFTPYQVIREAAAKRAVLDAVFEYEAGVDGEIGDCHSAADIAAGRCPFINPDEIPAVVALAEVYGLAALAASGKGEG